MRIPKICSCARINTPNNSTGRHAKHRSGSPGNVRAGEKSVESTALILAAAAGVQIEQHSADSTPAAISDTSKPGVVIGEQTSIQIGLAIVLAAAIWWAGSLQTRVNALLTATQSSIGRTAALTETCTTIGFEPATTKL